MLRMKTICFMLALLLALPLGVSAAQVDCDSVYCFSGTDFSPNESLAGICITQLPDSSAGTVMLGSRVIRSGDILTAGQVAQMTFCPLRTEEDSSAQVTYLPIFPDRVEPATTMTISIRGKEDKAPVAEDMALETYKNLPNKGQLKVTDPEGQALTFTVVRQPRRGQLTLAEDGSFTYTPKKNKVGVDSFTYTAADPAGNVSREATVTVQILKPTDARQYTDTVGQDCRFAAEWMRNTGLFVGERIGSQDCFYPEKAVSRGEFLSMVVSALSLPTEQVSTVAVPEETPQWLKPYLAAAIRAGLTAGIPVNEDGLWETDQPVTGAEAAVMLQNALDLDISRQTVETATQPSDIPVWAQVSLTAMAEHGIQLESQAALTRAQVAQILYQASALAVSAPGMAVLRMQ